MGEHTVMSRSKAIAARVADLFPVSIGRRFIRHDAATQAIVIAWNGLTSIFPITLGLAAVVGLTLSRAGISSRAMLELVVRVFPTDAGTQAAAMNGLQAVEERTGVFALAALVGFLWTGCSLFGAMERAFAVVFASEVRPFPRQQLVALTMMGLFAVLAVIAVGTSALLPLLSVIPGLPVALSRGWLAPGAQLVIGAVSGFVLFFVVYSVVPNRRQRVAHVLPGALFAGVAFEALTQLFPLFIRLNRGINQYGSSFAFLFVLLTFFYFLGVITMLGAELIAELDERRPGVRRVPR